jgi:hypothetical protein
LCAAGNKGVLPFPRLHIAELAVVVGIDRVAPRKLAGRLQGAVRLPKNADLHAGGADIDTEYGSHES